MSHLPSFRQIKLFVDTDPTLAAGGGGDLDLVKQAIDEVIGDPAVGNLGSLGSSLRDEGILIRTGFSTGLADFDQVGLSYVVGNESEVFGVLQREPERQTPYSFSIFLSARTAPEDAARDVPLGVTLGLDAYPRRFGAGRAAIVYPRVIAESLVRQGAAARRRLTQADVDDLAFRIRFTIMHELGHLLNLPHPWQRDAFAGVGLSAEPDARSWMAYGSLYPLGAPNIYALENIADETTRRERRDRLAQQNLGQVNAPLRGAGFTDEERGQIVHAPFDLVSAGGRTFVDAERQTLTIREPIAPVPRLRLAIDGATHDPAIGYEAVSMSQFTSQPMQSMFQPPTGYIELHVHKTAASEDLPFSFSTGNFFWLVREERPTVWTDRPPRRGVLFQPDYSVLTAPLDGAIEAVSAPSEVTLEGEPAWEFRVPLPPLSSSFLFTSFPNATRFTTQIAFLLPGAPLVYSNRVALIYTPDPSLQPFGPASREIFDLLGNPALPLVFEADLLFRDRTPAFISDEEVLLSRLRSAQADDLASLAREQPEALGWLDRLIFYANVRTLLDGTAGDREGQIFDQLVRLGRSDNPADQVHTQIAGGQINALSKVKPTDGDVLERLGRVLSSSN
ncbi:hypothetical protein F3S47_09575 [Histidinibacterium aquaticum]|uniref:Uncharacterized protein n=1 Tax=Histidinibacterium aquaticum TaxID=2613962 RepID=A0A5J5GML5_9RHOB|nr:hypothetical protein F3S47_09575 [Histidinibacterium aquaticum]